MRACEWILFPRQSSSPALRIRTRNKPKPGWFTVQKDLSVRSQSSPVGVLVAHNTVIRKSRLCTTLVPGRASRAAQTLPDAGLPDWNCAGWHADTEARQQHSCSSSQRSTCLAISALAEEDRPQSVRLSCRSSPSASPAVVCKFNPPQPHALPISMSSYSIPFLSLSGNLGCAWPRTSSSDPHTGPNLCFFFPSPNKCSINQAIAPRLPVCAVHEPSGAINRRTTGGRLGKKSVPIASFREGTLHP